MDVQIYKSEIYMYVCVLIEGCYSRNLDMDPKVIIKWWWNYHVLRGDTTVTKP